VNFIIFVHDRKNCSKSIVGGICFHNKLSIRDLVSKNGHRSEYLLKRVESIIAEVIKLPRNVFSSKVS